MKDLFGYDREWPRAAVAAMRQHLWLRAHPPIGRIANELSVWKRFSNSPAVTAWPYDSGHEAMLAATANLRTYCLLREEWDPGPCSVRIFWSEGGSLLHAVLGHVEKQQPRLQRESDAPTPLGAVLDRILAGRP